MKKKKLKPKIDVDALITRFETVDEFELAELRGIDYRTPRPISSIAQTMSIEMLRSPSGAAIQIPDPNLVFAARRILIEDLTILGLPHNRIVQCREKSNSLLFTYISRREPCPTAQS
jgi:hypothetical protein